MEGHMEDGGGVGGSLGLQTAQGMCVWVCGPQRDLRWLLFILSILLVQCWTHSCFPNCHRYIDFIQTIIVISFV